MSGLRKNQKKQERELVGSGAARAVHLISGFGPAVGDGFVTITIGDSITRFFEHADEVEEDEDDDSMDKDGNELDGECSRPHKHASPELARVFLIDAATVILRNKLRKLLEKGKHGKMHTSLCVWL
ncbi:hypothetical protein ACS0TY_030354 [Phlomoides rotata]